MLEDAKFRAWNRFHLQAATGGFWLRVPPENWAADGVKIYGPSVSRGDLIFAKGETDEFGVSFDAIRALPKPSGLVISVGSAPLAQREAIPDTPLLVVPNLHRALLDLAKYARQQSSGVFIGVTGSSGKTTFVAMLAAALESAGAVYKSAFNANSTRGVAWNLGSVRWDAHYKVLEMAVGNMGVNSRLVQPHVSILLNIHPAHIGDKHTIDDILRTKSLIFSGMAPGGKAVLNRDMYGFEVARREALKADQEVITYGRHEEADFRMLAYDGTSKIVRASVRADILDYSLMVEGEHMALNSLGVIAVLSVLGIPLESSRQPMERFRELAGRGEKFQTHFLGKTITVIDEAYNANPGSMVAALDRLIDLQHSGRKVVLLGQMEELGPASFKMHAGLLDTLATDAIDKIYVLGEKYEGLWTLLPKGQKGGFLKTLEDVEGTLLHELMEGDLLFIKGSHSTQLHKVVSRLSKWRNHVSCL